MHIDNVTINHHRDGEHSATIHIRWPDSSTATEVHSDAQAIMGFVGFGPGLSMYAPAVTEDNVPAPTVDETEPEEQPGLKTISDKELLNSVSLLAEHIGVDKAKEMVKVYTNNDEGVSDIPVQSRPEFMAQVAAAIKDAAMQPPATENAETSEPAPKRSRRRS